MKFINYKLIDYKSLFYLSFELLFINDFIIGIDVVIIESFDIWTLLYVFDFFNINFSIIWFLFFYELVISIELQIISLSILNIMR